MAGQWGDRLDNQANLGWVSLLQRLEEVAGCSGSPSPQIWECSVALSWGHPFILLLTGPWVKPSTHLSNPSAWDDIIGEAAAPFPAF